MVSTAGGGPPPFLANGMPEHPAMATSIGAPATIAAARIALRTKPSRFTALRIMRRGAQRQEIGGARTGGASHRVPRRSGAQRLETLGHVGFEQRLAQGVEIPLDHRRQVVRGVV